MTERYEPTHRAVDTGEAQLAQLVLGSVAVSILGGAIWFFLTLMHT